MINKQNQITGFLWSPCEYIWEEILATIRKYCNVELTMLYDFENKSDLFEEVVLKIYETDDISPSKVKNVKLNAMSSYKNKFLMFTIKLEDMNYRTKGISGNPISKSVETIKKKVRTSFRGSVDNYIHDIIIHLADNEDHSRQIEQMILEYEPYKKITKMRLKSLLSYQYVRGVYNRVDTLLRKYTIEQYSNNKDYDFNLYIKMMKCRVGKYNIDKFKILYESFKQNGFDERFPIPISLKNYTLINGSHRTAFAYFYDMEMIPVNILKKRGGKLFGKHWFQIKKFNLKEIKIIDEQIKKVEDYISED
jgi:hypothetical protein